MPSSIHSFREMSSIGTSKGILEVAKFALYVTVPIALMYTFANNTKNLQKVMGNVISLSLSRFLSLLFYFTLFWYFSSLYINIWGICEELVCSPWFCPSTFYSFCFIAYFWEVLYRTLGYPMVLVSWKKGTTESVCKTAIYFCDGMEI